MEKKICVIGAGPSGLAAIKSLKEEGFTHITCYELENKLGGMWNYTDQPKPGHSAGIHKRLCTNTSRETMCFSDFPHPDDTPMYLVHERLLQYLNDYARAFDLVKYVTFNTRVLHVKRSDDFQKTGRWNVTRQTQGEDIVEQVFDCVLVCTGIFHHACQPNIPGLHTFPGRVCFAADFRQGEEHQNKTVLVVGNGPSAGDVVDEVGQFAKKTYLAVGEGTWILPRFFPNCEPLCCFLNKRIASWSNPLTLNRALAQLLNTFVDHYQMNLANPRGPLFSNLMLSSLAGQNIGCGKIKVKGYLDSFSGKRAFFRDGTAIDDVDDVIFACGYKHDYPFLDKDVIGDDLSETNMYKQVWPFEAFQQADEMVQKHPTLAVVGCLHAPYGQLSIVELQTRWISRVFSRNCELPSADVMRKDGHAFWEGQRARFGSNRSLVSALIYLDPIADFIGCRPSIWRHLLIDPRVGWRLIFHTAVPCQWRLQGPHKWGKAREHFLGAYKRIFSNAQYGDRRVTEALPSDWSTTKVVVVILGAIFVGYYARQYYHKISDLFN